MYATRLSSYDCARHVARSRAIERRRRCRRSRNGRMCSVGGSCWSSADLRVLQQQGVWAYSHLATNGARQPRRSKGKRNKCPRRATGSEEDGGGGASQRARVVQWCKCAAVPLRAPIVPHEIARGWAERGQMTWEFAAEDTFYWRYAFFNWWDSARDTRCADDNTRTPVLVEYVRACVCTCVCTCVRVCVRTSCICTRTHTHIARSYSRLGHV